MKRRNLTINGEEISVTKANQRAREILKTPKIIRKKNKDYNFILWIFKQRRPSIEIDDTLLFKVDIGLDNKWNCFWFAKANDEWEAFSYKKAFESDSRKIENVQGITYSKSDYLHAFRNTVYDQIKGFRERELKKSPTLAALDAEDSFSVHTDHVIPMHILISDFLNDKGLKLPDIELEKKHNWNIEIYLLKEGELSEEWQNYHQAHARLRLITREENLSKAGTQDIPLYNYRKKRAETYD